MLCTSQFSGTNGNQLGIISAPHFKDKCGSDRVLAFDNKGIPEKTFQATSLTSKDSCTWVIKAVCDAPGFYLSALSEDDALAISFMQYDLYMNT